MCIIRVVQHGLVSVLKLEQSSVLNIVTLNEPPLIMLHYVKLIYTFTH